MKIALLSFFLILTSVTAMAGGSDRGGGSALTGPDQKPILLDFAASGVSMDSSGPVEVLGQTPFSQAFGFDFMKLWGQSKAKIEVARAIDRLEYPKIKRILRFALSNLRLIYTFRSLKKLDSIHIPKNLESRAQDIKTVIFYDLHFGGIMDAELFNSMGGVSQAGLFLHESLRRLQLVYQIPVSDEDIQHMTYYAFRDRLGAAFPGSVARARKVFERIESSLVDEGDPADDSNWYDSSQRDELILVNHLRNWLCSKFNELPPGARSKNICSEESIRTLLARKPPSYNNTVSLRGDWIVELDVIRSEFNPRSRERNILDHMRYIATIQLFHPNVLELWYKWEKFPTPQQSTSFAEPLKLWNSPESTGLSHETILRAKAQYEDLIRDVRDYFKQHYFFD